MSDTRDLSRPLHFQLCFIKSNKEETMLCMCVSLTQCQHASHFNIHMKKSSRLTKYCLYIAGNVSRHLLLAYKILGSNSDIPLCFDGTAVFKCQGEGTGIYLGYNFREAVSWANSCFICRMSGCTEGRAGICGSHHRSQKVKSELFDMVTSQTCHSRDCSACLLA